MAEIYHVCSTVPDVELRYAYNSTRCYNKIIPWLLSATRDIIFSGNYFPEKSWTLVTDNIPQGLSEYYNKDRLRVIISKQITVAQVIYYTLYCISALTHYTLFYPEPETIITNNLASK